MVLVAVQLGPLVLLDGVLDRQRVEPELLRDDLQVLLVGLAQVQPHHRVRLLEVVGDLGGWEVLGLQLPLSVQPGVTHAASLSPRGVTGSGCGEGELDLLALVVRRNSVQPGIMGSMAEADSMRSGSPTSPSGSGTAAHAVPWSRPRPRTPDPYAFGSLTGIFGRLLVAGPSARAEGGRGVC